MVDVVETLKRALWLLAMAAFLSGCTTPVQPQYQSAVSSLGSEECRALQAVIEDRERYGIIAPSRAADEDALRQCGLPHGGSDTSMLREIQSRPPMRGSEEVQIEKRGDSYLVPVRINNTITLPFLLDTGASDLVVPADVALTLVRAGALTSGDFIGKTPYRLADGSEGVSELVVLREVRVGEHSARNVTATISSLQAEPLLGQSFLSKFGKVTLDYKRLVLVLSP
jgi:aspartyl protease family protein